MASRPRSPRRPSRTRRGSWLATLWRIARTVVVVAFLLALLPVVLAALYRIEAIHPVSTLMLGDSVLSKPMRRDWVELDDVADVMKFSVVMSEDGQFCRHRGVDWGALNEVIGSALDGERARGASTITMQSVKNLFLWNSRSFIRKALEIPYAVWMDAVLSKQRIMEIYLNIAEWGPGIYGVEAASWHYFDKPAFALTAREAALLTVTLPNPGARNPARPGPGLQKLAGLIQNRTAKATSHVACLR